VRKRLIVLLVLGLVFGWALTTLAAGMSVDDMDLTNNSGLNWRVLGGQAGLGVVMGFAVGFVLKKSLKMALFLVGTIVLLQVLLTQFGFVTIHWDKIQASYDSAVATTGGGKGIIDSVLAWLSNSIAIGGGLAVGFFAGLKMG